LLDIFHVCSINELHLNLWKWDRLAQVCRRWRQIVFASPQRLQIHLLCTHGTPFRTHLSCWPAFPIIVDYASGDKSLAPSDKDNVLAALEHSEHLYTLYLTLKTSQLAKLVAVMQEPHSILEYLWLTFGPNAPVLPRGFLGGSTPCLQQLEFDSVPFPTLPSLLASAKNLGELRLYNIPKSGYISPEALVTGLAASTCLWLLHIAFRSDISYPNQNSLPPVTRAVLSALRTIEFQGASDYLEDLVARLDCPTLRWIKISYLHRGASFRAVQFVGFINRLENPQLRQFLRLEVRFLLGGICLEVCPILSRAAIWITFKGATWGTSQLIQVFRQFSTKLSEVVHLSIFIHFERPGPEIGQNEWVQLLHPFTSVRTLRVKDRECQNPPAIEGVTQTDAEMLPALCLLYVECEPQLVCLKFFERFVAARKLSNSPVTAVRREREFHDRFQMYYAKEEREELLRVTGICPGAT
jgi:hypothetical protein